jgi:hypothetical protein
MLWLSYVLCEVRPAHGYVIELWRSLSLFKIKFFKIKKLKKFWIQASPLPEGLASTAWEPSKLPNFVSITPRLTR